MKVGESCFQCIKGLAHKTLELIGAKDESFREVEKFIEDNWRLDATPPSLANGLLKMIKERFNVDDPYESFKSHELMIALKTSERLQEFFPEDILGAIKFSALGNSSDFFMETDFNYEKIDFFADLEKIEKGLSESCRVLILGDNISDFIFDLKLIRYLERIGKEVYYAVKESPVQNDLSIPDLRKYGLRRFFDKFISTGDGEVGLRKEYIRGLIKELWEGETFIIAKGMGNYETLTEYSERPILYVMKVKCKEVSKSIGYPIGTYLALYR
jgi:uncharacterized protein with ATP-grasp and redox domains